MSEPLPHSRLRPFSSQTPLLPGLDPLSRPASTCATESDPGESCKEHQLHKFLYDDPCFRLWMILHSVLGVSFQSFSLFWRAAKSSVDSGTEVMSDVTILGRDKGRLKPRKGLKCADL